MKVTGTQTQTVNIDITPKEALIALADHLLVPLPETLQDPNAEFTWHMDYENNQPVRLCQYRRDNDMLHRTLTRMTHSRMIDRFAAIECLADCLD